MSTTAIHPRDAARATLGRRARSAARWVAQIGLASQFAVAGFLKLTADPQMVHMFDNIGAGQWLRIVVAVLELVGAAGLLVPRLAGLAAVGLVALMTGAAVTNIAVLGTSPAMPLAFLVVAAIIAILRRRQVTALLSRTR